jgi:HAE1 family hydrophobic/amphiphilic exporter-1
MRSFEANLKAQHLPPNVSVKASQGGQQELMAQTLKGIGTSLILSVVLVYLLMVALYNDFRDPLIILFAVPVAIVGAVFALLVTHQTLNLYSLIGSLLLVGLVTKNGILLVDYANTLRRRDGKSKRDAVIDSGATRFRPIIMTTMAMIAGMLPLALALEPGSQSRASLGAVVIGGLSSSLILTLFIVPIMYLWLAPDELSEPIKIGRKKDDGGSNRGEGPAGSGREPAPQPAR